MLERLEKGEDPWRIIFNKWGRIKKRCKLYGGTDLPISIFGDSCVLCELRSLDSRPAICCFGYEEGTLPCPLVQIGERCSGNEGSVWGEFSRNPSVETTQKMIQLLRRAKKGIVES